MRGAGYRWELRVESGIIDVAEAATVRMKQANLSWQERLMGKNMMTGKTE